MHPDLIEEINLSFSRDHITEAWDIGLTEETECEEIEFGPQPTKDYWKEIFQKEYDDWLNSQNLGNEIPF